MAKKRKVSISVADLLVTDSAKSTIENLLDIECSSTMTRSPSKAEKLRRIILNEISLSLSNISSLCSGKMRCHYNTVELVKELVTVSEYYRRNGKFFLSHIFTSLRIELIHTIITPKRHFVDSDSKHRSKSKSEIKTLV